MSSMLIETGLFLHIQPIMGSMKEVNPHLVLLESLLELEICRLRFCWKTSNQWFWKKTLFEFCEKCHLEPFGKLISSVSRRRN